MALTQLDDPLDTTKGHSATIVEYPNGKVMITYRKPGGAYTGHATEDTYKAALARVQRDLAVFNRGRRPHLPRVSAPHARKP